MDQDRWEAAATWLQSCQQSSKDDDADDDSTTSGSGSSPSKKQASSTTTRYKHDMELAEAMRKEMQTNQSNKQKQSSSTTSRSTSRTSTTMDNVWLGLQGLEEADQLSQQQPQEVSVQKDALKLYEQSLEMLIRSLRDDAAVAQLESIDREALEARVLVALSDAESIKARLSSRRMTRIATRQQTQSAAQQAAKTRSTASRFEGITNALSAALG
jgi:DNA primase